MPTGVYLRKHKTHCKRGHERTLENLNNDGKCRICIRVYHKSYIAQQKEVNNTWYAANKDILQQKVKLLADSYLAQRLGLKLSDIPPEVLEMKRQLILLKRGLKHETTHNK